MGNKKHHSYLAEEKIHLHLFVSGMSEKSMRALENLTKFCDKYLLGMYELDITDIYKDPSAAEAQQIVFSPCLIKLLPLPRKIAIGTFDDPNKLIAIFGITFKEQLDADGVA